MVTVPVVKNTRRDTVMDKLPWESVVPDPGETVAMKVLLDDTLHARPAAANPPAVRASTVSTVELVPNGTDMDAGRIATDATGGATTVTAAVPVAGDPPVPGETDAVTVADPALTAVATPVPATMLSTAGLLLDHDTTRPLRTLPDASFTTALKACTTVSASVGAAGETSTEWANANTRITRVALTVSPDALSVATPGETPVTVIPT
jgi:hypothetical protein